MRIRRKGNGGRRRRENKEAMLISEGEKKLRDGRQ